MKKHVVVGASIVMLGLWYNPAEARKHIPGHSVRVTTRHNNASPGTAK